MYNTPYSERMNLKGHVQGFVAGAALTAGALVGYPLMFGGPGEHETTQQIVEAFGVEVVWNINACDLRTGIANDGCFMPDTPNTIYVRPGRSPERERHIVLHEIAHVIQHRLGLPVDDCDADRFAQSLGSFRGDYCYGTYLRQSN